MSGGFIAASIGGHPVCVEHGSSKKTQIALLSQKLFNSPPLPLAELAGNGES